MDITIKLNNVANNYTYFDVYAISGAFKEKITSNLNRNALTSITGQPLTIPDWTDELKIVSIDDGTKCGGTEFVYSITELLKSYIYRVHNADDKMNIVIEMKTLGGSLYPDNSSLKVGFTSTPISYETIQAANFDTFTMSATASYNVLTSPNSGSVLIEVESTITDSNADTLEWTMSDIIIPTTATVPLIFKLTDSIVLGTSSTVGSPVEVYFERERDDFIFNVEIV